jgi:hypothetical protein
MSAVRINWQPDRKTLAEFSEFGMFFLGMVAAPLAYFRGHVALAATFWALAVVGRVLGFVKPAWLRPAYIGLTVVTYPIGWVVSYVLMVAVYFLVFVPIAVVFRILGRDPLSRALDRQAKTYWMAYNPDRGMERYLRQF